jgi:hypothetical protein
MVLAFCVVHAWGEDADIRAGEINAESDSFYYWAVAHGTWHSADSGYTPQPGDVAVYGSSAAAASHVGIVTGSGSSGPDVVNGDWEIDYPTELPTAVAYRANESTEAGLPVVGYASPVAPAAALSVTTSSVASGTTGLPYTASLAASGGQAPYTWKLTSGQLPPGLSLSSSGSVSGVPLADGTDPFTVSVSDSASGTASAALSITVIESSYSPPPDSVTEPNASAGEATGGWTLFGIGTSGHLETSWQTFAGSRWTKWASLGGKLKGSPVIVPNSTADLSTEGWTAFALSTSGHLETAWQTFPGSRWTKWASLGGQLK